MHYHQALAMWSQLAHIFHIYERTGGICRSNRNQQSDGTENFWSQRAIFVMGWPLNHARTMPITENIRSRSQPILKRDLTPRDQSRFTPCCRYWRLDAASACNDYACVKSFSDLSFVSSLFRLFSPRCQSIIRVLPRYLYVTMHFFRPPPFLLDEIFRSTAFHPNTRLMSEYSDMDSRT